MERRFESHSEAETMAIAREIGKQAVRGDIYCLSGEPGAGKTHFAKGFAEAFGIPAGEVNSPTFTLVQEYTTGKGLPLYHFDFYRIEHLEEALEIGSEEYFYGEGVSIIEWPEKISGLLPEHAIRIELTIPDRNSRHIVIKYPTDRSFPT